MPTITRIADLSARRPSLPPVEEFERPIKGDPDEWQEIQGQRVLILMLFVVVVGFLLWSTRLMLSGGAQ